MLKNQSHLSLCIQYRKSLIFWSIICAGYLTYICFANLKTSISSFKFCEGNKSIKFEKFDLRYRIYCDRKKVNSSELCLCYKTKETDPPEVKCAMTFDAGGRMGNRIGQFSTLLTLSRLNHRPAFMTPVIANSLTPYFELSMPVLSQEMYDGIRWNEIWINDWMNDTYKNFTGLFVKVKGYPFSNTFFKGFENLIREEFQLKHKIRDKAQRTLRDISANRSSVTFVGVHVRRRDYVKLMKNAYHGVLADRNYFIEATDYFRKRYSDVIFVVVSNDMQWCRDNILNDEGDVYFVGNNDESDPITDFALLMNCNHSIITIGTYGFFSALLAGGDVVYLTNFTMPDSPWNTFFHYDTAFPPNWHPIAADLSPKYAELGETIPNV